MAQLINKHGRLVSVSNSRVQELLKSGFRKPEEQDIARAAAEIAERNTRLREVLTVDGQEDDESLASAEEAQPTLKEQVAELLQSGKKADLETALTAAGLNPEDFLTNEDRKAALQEFLGAEG